MKQRSLFSKPKETAVEKPKIKKGPKLVSKKQFNSKNIIALINRRERQILVHSYLYYERDANLISDSMYDKISVELVELISKHKHEFEKSAYYYEFINFDGNTGFDLNYKMADIAHVADHLLKIS